MAEQYQLPAIPRKPLPDAARALKKPLTRSQSTLYKAWSTQLPPLQDYERSLYKFPWLHQTSRLDQAPQILESEGEYLLFRDEEAGTQGITRNDPSRLIQGSSGPLLNHGQASEKDESTSPHLVSLTFTSLEFQTTNAA